MRLSKASAADCRLVRMSDRFVVVTRLETAYTFWKRFKGLQFRRQLLPGSGLHIAPCSSIHTCFMRFPVDVAMLDRDGYVLSVRADLKPWRILLAPRATQSVVEMPCGAVEVRVGDQLQIVRQGDDKPLPIANVARSKAPGGAD